MNSPDFGFEGLRKRKSEVVRLVERFAPYLASSDTFDILVNPARYGLPGVRR
jgi:hypothetical protein